MADNIVDFAHHKRVTELLREIETLKQESRNLSLVPNTSHQAENIPDQAPHPDCLCRLCAAGITSSEFE